MQDPLDVTMAGQLPPAPADRARTSGRLRVMRQVWREHRLWIAIVGVHLGVGATLDGLGILDVIRPGGLWNPPILLQFLLLTMLWLPIQIAHYRWEVREHGRRVNGWRS